jgi:hypothetical protein
VDVRKFIVGILAAIDARSTFEFLLERIKEAQPQLVAEILGQWQGMHQSPEAQIRIAKLLPVLHQLLAMPQAKCLYFDSDGIESDCRYWVCRCLQGLKRKGSRVHLEAFLDSSDGPIETLVEAAMAHWCVTGTTKYALILRRAAKQKVDLSKRQVLLEEDPRERREAEIGPPNTRWRRRRRVMPAACGLAPALGPPRGCNEWVFAS